MSRVAVVLFNLGGPDSLDAVEPFLFNLFADPAIIALPNPLRFLLAKLIARRRAPLARAIFARIGNASPLLANTQAQARALETALGDGFKIFIAMRYWGPSSADAAQAVKRWGAEEVVLLPLYPQFSSTTTASSLRIWRRAAAAAGLGAPARALCCAPDEPGFVTALAARLRTALAAWPPDVPVRILLSAHGLPKRIVARGDPYQWQVELTAAALREKLGRPELDCVVCYQSRVGPLEWLQPATDAEIRRAGGEKIGLMVLPIAFVSEHSETLVELDLDYRELAEREGVPRYVRVPTVSADAAYIAGLAALVAAAQRNGETVLPDAGRRRCPERFTLCACGEPVR
jgi:protoporphyrin/coproporphyrin ferrochelatase